MLKLHSHPLSPDTSFITKPVRNTSSLSHLNVLDELVQLLEHLLDLDVGGFGLVRLRVLLSLPQLLSRRPLRLGATHPDSVCQREKAVFNTQRILDVVLLLLLLTWVRVGSSPPPPNKRRVLCRHTFRL